MAVNIFEKCLELINDKLNLTLKCCFPLKFTKSCILSEILFYWCQSFLNVMQESKISCFHEGIGVCEQLMGIPIPLSYTRLTSRFLVLWHLTLPIILWDDCHWIVIPATFISAASLFCIEEVCIPGICHIMCVIECVLEKFYCHVIIFFNFSPFVIEWCSASVGWCSYRGAISNACTGWAMQAGLQQHSGSNCNWQNNSSSAGCKTKEPL
jgi:predicted membrane chloride channel (bestrophin family)